MGADFHIRGDCAGGMGGMVARSPNAAHGVVSWSDSATPRVRQAGTPWAEPSRAVMLAPARRHLLTFCGAGRALVMRRRLFNLAAVLSLVLCLGYVAVAVAGRSGPRTLAWDVRDPSDAIFVLADSGHVRVIRQRVSRTEPGIGVDVARPGLLTVHSAGSISLYAREGAGWEKAVSSPPWKFLRGGTEVDNGVVDSYMMVGAPSPSPTDFAYGFAVNVNDVDVVSFAGSYRSVYVPHWFLIGVTALLPLGRGVSAAIWRVRRRHRMGADCCAVCGYDLRATPDCCPECGTVRQKKV
jgi:hypothetical protein